MFPRPGPGPDPLPPGTKHERPPLTLPTEHGAFIDQQLASGRYFGNRFPSHAEFQEFLQANLNWRFNEQSFYECSMSCCGGGPVGEGFNTDIDIKAPEWFREFERRTQGKEMWTGAELLPVLLSIDGNLPTPKSK